MDASAPEALSRDRLSDRLYAVLKGEIGKGELTPGQRLVEADLARRYAVSHAPVREALRRLAHEGLVVQLPRRGTFVTSVSEEEARRSHALRAVLEEFAAREFCRHASSDSLDQVAAIVDRMVTAADDDDVVGVSELNTKFHQAVWAASGHPLLPRIWPLVESSLRAFTPITDRVYVDDLVEVASSHRPLVDSLRSRDESRAAQQFHDHVTDVWRKVEASSPAPTSSSDD